MLSLIALDCQYFREKKVTFLTKDIKQGIWFFHFDTAFWNSFSHAGSVDFDFDFSFLLFVPEDPDDSVEDDDELDHVADDEEELVAVEDEELDHVDAGVDELDPIVPSLLKLSGPQTDSTSWPVFHFSAMRLLGTAWK